eukprot:CAMPEP_0196809682 /NCGR_PEP_ID=MMETSP1362-20130617/9588_1 /TAXON_ID=163516 /ORGANISM="Leptocylindrus danicus, Strain CCMP1856" /LENGTH=589 /DNA_ID=CAMNT_0042184439 /DNA_START=277 /DNA_END=2046 /DNA_ORIENTATION=-
MTIFRDNDSNDNSGNDNVEVVHADTNKSSLDDTADCAAGLSANTSTTCSTLNAAAALSHRKNMAPQSSSSALPPPKCAELLQKIDSKAQRHMEEMESLRKRMDRLRNSKQGGLQQQVHLLEQNPVSSDVNAGSEATATVRESSFDVLEQISDNAANDVVTYNDESSSSDDLELMKIKTEMQKQLQEANTKMEQQQKFSSSKYFFEMEELRKNHVAESKRMKAEHAKQMHELEQKFKAREEELGLQIGALKKAQNEKSDDSSDQMMEKMVRMACAEKVTELENIHAMELEKRLAEKDEEMQNRLTANTIEITSSVTGNITLAMSQRIVAAEELAEKRTEELEKLRAETNAELDEVLQSLDRVEAEYNGKLADVQSALDQKEIAYSSASAQLAESLAAKQQAEAECRRLEMEAHSSNATIVSLRLDLKTAHEEKSRALEEERVLRLDAVEAAKSEMRAAAEQQFAEANRHFLSLKREYELSIEDIKVLKVEKQKADTAALQANRKEAQMLSEIAQLKAELATLDAKVAKQAHEMIMLSSNDRGDEYKAECESVRKSLSLVEADKARLVKENQELSAVCEELMSLVEGNDAG